MCTSIAAANSSCTDTAVIVILLEVVAELVEEEANAAARMSLNVPPD